MIQQILIKLGCSFIAILTITLFYKFFGIGGLGAIAGASTCLALILLCEKFGILKGTY